jgi:hypothetical protein
MDGREKFSPRSRRGPFRTPGYYGRSGTAWHEYRCELQGVRPTGIIAAPAMTVRVDTCVSPTSAQIRRGAVIRPSVPVLTRSSWLYRCDGKRTCIPPPHLHVKGGRKECTSCQRHYGCVSRISAVIRVSLSITICFPSPSASSYT